MLDCAVAKLVNDPPSFGAPNEDSLVGESLEMRGLDALDTHVCGGSERANKNTTVRLDAVVGLVSRLVSSLQQRNF